MSYQTPGRRRILIKVYDETGKRVVVREGQTHATVDDCCGLIETLISTAVNEPESR